MISVPAEASLKMSTSLGWKASDLYARVFQSLWTYPIQWSRLKRRLEYNSNPRDLRVWIGVTVVIIFLIMFGSSAYYFIEISFLSPHKEVRLSQFMAVVLIGIVTGFYSLSPLLAFPSIARDACRGLNELFQYEYSISKELRFPMMKESKETTEGRVVYSTVVVLSVLPFFAMISVHQNSPYYALMTSITESTGAKSVWLEVLIQATNAVLVFITGFEVCRAIAGLALMLSIGWSISSFSVILLGRLDRWQISKFYDYFTRLVIIQHTLERGQAMATLGMMVMGAASCVCCNYATIKMQSIIPMPFYLIFPTISLVVACITQQTLPNAIRTLSQV